MPQRVTHGEPWTMMKDEGKKIKKNNVYFSIHATSSNLFFVLSSCFLYHSLSASFSLSLSLSLFLFVWWCFYFGNFISSCDFFFWISSTSFTTQIPICRAGFSSLFQNLLHLLLQFFLKSYIRLISHFEHARTKLLSVYKWLSVEMFAEIDPGGRVAHIHNSIIHISEKGDNFPVHSLVYTVCTWTNYTHIHTLIRQ